MQFKRGAFAGEHTITPQYLKYRECMVYSAFEVVEQGLIMLLNLCWIPGFVCEVGVLPTMFPTDYLYETHSDKGKDKWEIYAWAVREVIMKAGGFKSYDIKNANKLKN